MEKILDQIELESEQTGASIRSLCAQKAQTTEYKAETLRKALNRRRQERDRDHGQMLFSAKQESIICALALSFAARGMPLTKSLLINLVRKAFKQPDDWTGDGWFRGFKERFADRLSFSSSKSLDKDHISKVTEEQVDKFINAFDHLQEYNVYQPDFIINVDESSCKLKNDHPVKVLKSASASKQGSIKAPPSALRTIVPFVAASGKVWMVVYIFKRVGPKSPSAKDTVTLRTVKRQTRGSWTSYYAMTEEGYVTNDLWIDIIAKFINLIKVHLGNRPAVLILDRVGPHLEDSTLTSLLDNDISTLFLPAHTSHILQPLDDVIFSLFKVIAHRKLAEELIGRNLRGESLNTATQDAIFEAEQEAFTPDIIQAGFKNTGVWPFNKKLIRDRFAEEYEWAKESDSDTDANDEVDEVLRTIDDYFNSKQSDTKTRVSAINTKSKLFLGSEIHEAHMEAQKIKAEKEAKKAEKAKLKEEKKRKAVDDKLDSKRPRKKAKISEEELADQISFEISEDSLIECSGCDGLIDDYWTCPTCNTFNLCEDCQVDEEIETEHAKTCQKNGRSKK